MSRERVRVIARRRRRDPGPWLPWVLLALGLAACAGLEAAQAQDTGLPKLPPGSTAPATPPGGGSLPPAGAIPGQQPSVIHPPTSTDSKMTKPPPNPKAYPMPVIPPPGTPGGNPQVVPK